VHKANPRHRVGHVILSSAATTAAATSTLIFCSTTFFPELHLFLSRFPQNELLAVIEAGYFLLFISDNN